MNKELTLLIVFVKNPELGKVKTRLAKSVGDEDALMIYRALLDHTANVAREAQTSRAVYYSDYIDDNDQFDTINFGKFMQSGEDLGTRMSHAFSEGLLSGFSKVVIIGSDCYELSTAVIDEAFKALESHDTVLGPARDGGYYLLGLRELYPQLFENKEWSTENVFLDTLLDVKELGLSYHLLPTLSDIDHVDDLGELSNLLTSQNNREEQ